MMVISGSQEDRVPIEVNGITIGFSEHDVYTLVPRWEGSDNVDADMRKRFIRRRE